MTGHLKPGTLRSWTAAVRSIAAALGAARSELEVLVGAALAVGAIAAWSLRAGILALGVVIAADGLYKRRAS